MSGKRPFQFVSVEQPNGRPTSDGQKAVRSWVTKAQHVHRRQLKGIASGQEGDDDESTASSMASSPRDNAVEPDRDPGLLSPRSSKVSKKHPSGMIRWQSKTPRPARRTSEERKDRSQNRHLVIAADTRREESPRENVSPETHPEASNSWNLESLATPLCPALDDPTDMLSVYAFQLDTDPQTLWTHYLWQEREHGNMFRTHYQDFSGFASARLHPLILSDPAMLATTVLFTACHLNYQHGLPVLSPALLRIHSIAYKFVQAALDRPSDQLTDATLIAVMKLALFELIFGYRTAFETHMHGIAQMVRLRNRPGALHLALSRYTAHLLVWFDGNLSAAAQTPRFLEGEPALEYVQSPFVDTERFMLGVR